MFEQFEDFVFGTRAMIKLLSGYIDKGFNTVLKIVNRYAPASDGNAPLVYAEMIADRVGVGVNEVLTADKATLKGLAQQMAIVENGADYVTDQIFNEAWNIL